MEKDSIKKLQKYVEEKIKERGFDDETWEETLLILVEETGELIKACRSNLGIGHVKDSEPTQDVGEELSDLLFMTFSLAYVLEIDLEEAFMRKQEKIEKRKYGRISKKNRD